MQAIVDADQAVVARIGSQVVLLHHIHTRGGHREEVAAPRLAAQAEIRAVGLAAGARLNAAAIELALEAAVLGHVVVQHLLAEAVLFQPAQQPDRGGERSRAP